MFIALSCQPLELLADQLFSDINVHDQHLSATLCCALLVRILHFFLLQHHQKMNTLDDESDRVSPMQTTHIFIPFMPN
jgi:hypothetical protein